MKYVSELCKPRASVFVDTTRDDVLNLSDLIEGRIDVDRFFNENFKTKGMEILFHTAFSRFQGKSATGVIKLTQAMGGGKTHSMLALALLAKNLKWRAKILGKSFDDIGDIKVIAFSGRESDEPFGIWGRLADQLGKKDLFSGLYSPLRAPGESAWVNLLQGEKTLILLDELPPYLENARAISVGNSDLCKVTITALSNLFTALGKDQLANVCLVFSDLKATYESGSELLQSSFKELENEANRVAINIEPVALNSDEIYDILRKRLFEIYPENGSPSLNEVAIGYKDAIANARKSGLTTYQPDKMYLGVRDSYPFHPSIKELYARFKENQNFQQTRGLIRLMRQIVRQFYENGRADQTYLINVFEIDLNHATMVSYIREIKPSLDNAISHDIAQQGKAVAEVIDAEYEEEFHFPYAQLLSKLLLMSSLNETAHGLQGLNDSDILAYLCEPGIDLNQFKKVLEDIKSQCWYLKMDNRGRYYFQNTKNMVAEMNTLVDSYSNESAKKELRKFLETHFTPKLKKCYELLYVMPAIDEIQLDMNKVALIIYEPYAGTGLHRDLRAFFDNAIYKNRVMFLSGQRSVMEKLYENSKRLTAIRQIIKSMQDEHVPETDQQFREANDQSDKATTALLSTIRETFITLYFPAKNGITNNDFKLEFTGNKFNGEEQIVKTLAEEQKFQDYSSDEKSIDTLRKKCESRIFTQKEMTWAQIIERAATEVSWQWYHPDQMLTLKKACINKDVWREVGGYLQKGPFDKEPTQVVVEPLGYDEKTKEFTLKIRAVHGNVVYFDIGAPPSKASSIASNPFITKETVIWFLCVDTSTEDPHPVGEPVRFLCAVPLKHEQRASAQGNVMQFASHPNFEIRYTTDGSNPKESGGKYSGEFLLPTGCKFVLVAVYNQGELVEEKTIPITENKKDQKQVIKDDKPLEYTFKSMKKCSDTAATYADFAMLQKLTGTLIRHFTVVISQKEQTDNYMEISTAKIPYDAENLQATVDLIRDTAFSGIDVVVEFEYKTILFLTGAAYKEWVEINKLDLNDLARDGDIKQ